LQSEIVIVEGRAPLLKPQRFSLFKIHRDGFAVQMLVACTVIEAQVFWRGLVNESLEGWTRAAMTVRKTPSA
jgi:exosortase/archaeosortase